MKHEWDNWKTRSNLSKFFSDFMDALCDYECNHYTRVEFRERLIELNDIYKVYSNADVMYKATIQRLASVARSVERNDALKWNSTDMKESEGKWQMHWIKQESNMVKHPPKIIF